MAEIIGFIGLGVMGKPMALNLIKGGHKLFLHSRSGVPQELTAAGGTGSASAKEVAQKADIIITMVPDTPDVEKVLIDQASAHREMREFAAAFMADAQVPWGVDALAGAVTEPAWRNKPSHYLVATEDKMIPPPAQRAMAQRAKAQVTEVPGSHAVYVSKPAEVAEFIRRAADTSV